VRRIEFLLNECLSRLSHIENCFDLVLTDDLIFNNDLVLDTFFEAWLPLIRRDFSFLNSAILVALVVKY